MGHIDRPTTQGDAGSGRFRDSVSQPVHVVYGGAHLFKAGIANKLGQVALTALAQHGPITGALSVSAAVAERVRAKLTAEPVEDYRIDFEDGYGFRSDAEEDGHAIAAAQELVRGLDEGTLPPMIGIRIKPLNHELWHRSIRTLELFLQETKGRLPNHFIVTLPKIVSAQEPGMLAAHLEQIEERLELAVGTIRMELMIETPQAFHGSNLHKFLAAGRHRVVGAHFGPFDYQSNLGIAANAQDLNHPVCDMARHLMQIAYAPEGIWLSTGPTNVMPVGDTAAVRGAWLTHFDQVRHALKMGFYQAWDLHPAQLISRYAAVFSFYAEALEPMSARLRNFVERAAQATLVGQAFDDYATGQGLLNFFLRAIRCGAVTEEEAREGTGLTHEQIASGSFGEITAPKKRRGGPGAAR